MSANCNESRYPTRISQYYDCPFYFSFCFSGSYYLEFTCPYPRTKIERLFDLPWSEIRISEKGKDWDDAQYYIGEVWHWSVRPS